MSTRRDPLYDSRRNSGIRGGTARRDQYGNLVPGEYDQYDQPIGTAPRLQGLQSGTLATGAPSTGPDAFDAFFHRPQPVRAPMAPIPLASGATSPMINTPIKLGLGTGAQPTASSAAPVPTSRPLTTPTATTARPSVLPSSPDDRALLMQTRARDSFAKQPAPISIPGGDPAARAWNTARGTGHPGTPEPGAVTPAAPVDPYARSIDPTIAAAAGTGRVLKTAYGTASSTLADPNTPRPPAIVGPNGVTHPEPAASSAAPPQGVPMSTPAPASVATAAPAAAPAPAVTNVPALPAQPASAPAPATTTAPTPANALGQAVRQGAGNAAMAVTGAIDRHLAAPMMDAFGTARNFAAGLMGSNASVPAYQPLPAVAAPAMPAPQAQPARAQAQSPVPAPAPVDTTASRQDFLDRRTAPVAAQPGFVQRARDAAVDVDQPRSAAPGVTQTQANPMHNAPDAFATDPEETERRRRQQMAL